jgi:hypothetical protein
LTRREFLSAIWIAGAPTASRAALVIPVRLVVDNRTPPALVQRFWSRLWPQATQNFAAGGMRLDVTVINGEVKRTAGGRPIFMGLDRSMLNFVITEQLPMVWDRGRALNGATTQYEGYHICMAALKYAHTHQIPLLSVNTCVHELLHALMGDIFDDRPVGVHGATRELGVDWFATRLWLFHNGAQIRASAQAYLNRLRWEVGSRS